MQRRIPLFFLPLVAVAVSALAQEAPAPASSPTPAESPDATISPAETPGPTPDETTAPPAATGTEAGASPSVNTNASDVPEELLPPLSPPTASAGGEAPAASPPAPTPSPAGTPAPQEQPVVAAPTPTVDNIAVFRAVASSDLQALGDAIAAGADPNAELPNPAPPDFATPFKSSPLCYVVTVMRGVTPLMLAACIGDPKICHKLIESGANPNARSKPNGTTALWLAGYFHKGAVMQMLLGVEPGSATDKTSVEIDIAHQTARVLRSGTPGEPMPISTGRQGYGTPKGEFVITDKHEQWRSTLYGASMPYYMRLSCQAFGMHAGELPGYPASHGCIRMRLADAKALFAELPVGTRVVIK